MQFHNHELKEHFNKRRKEQLQMILNDYLEAQKRGDIRKDVKPEFILFFINHMFEMAKDPQLEKLYDHPQDMIMELTRFFSL